jgi:hypothetical protein
MAALRSLKHHTKEVTCLAFSPDGSVLASGSRDASVVLVDLKSGNVLNTLKHHANWVTCVAISPDGCVLASGSYDKSVVLVDLTPGNVTNGNKLAHHTTTDKSVLKFDAKSGNLQLKLTHHTSALTCLAFSPDGCVLASGSESIVLFDSNSGNLLLKLSHHTSAVRCLAFSPDGSVLASGSRDELVVLADAKSGSVLHKLEHHADGVMCLAFSPDGSVLASGSRDKSVVLVDALSGSVLHTLAHHTDMVWCLAFSPDGSVLASGSRDKSVVLVDAKLARILHKLKHHTKEVWCLAFSPDGSVLASGSEDTSIALVPHKVFDNFVPQIRAVVLNDPVLLVMEAESSGTLDPQAVRMLCQRRTSGECTIATPAWIIHLDQLRADVPFPTGAIKQEVRSTLDAEYNAGVSFGAVTGAADATKCLREHVEAVLCTMLQRLVDAAVADPEREVQELTFITERLLDVEWWYPNALVVPMQEVYAAKILEEVRMANLDELQEVADRQLEDDLRIYSAIHDKERNKPEYSVLAAEVEQLESNVRVKQGTKPRQPVLVAGSDDAPLSVSQVKAHAADAHAAYVAHSICLVFQDGGVMWLFVSEKCTAICVSIPPSRLARSYTLTQ